MCLLFPLLDHVDLDAHLYAQITYFFGILEKYGTQVSTPMLITVTHILQSHLSVSYSTCFRYIYKVQHYTNVIWKDNNVHRNLDSILMISEIMMQN